MKTCTAFTIKGDTIPQVMMYGVLGVISDDHVYRQADAVISNETLSALCLCSLPISHDYRDK